MPKRGATFSKRHWTAAITRPAVNSQPVPARTQRGHRRAEAQGVAASAPPRSACEPTRTPPRALAQRPHRATLWKTADSRPLRERKPARPETAPRHRTSSACQLRADMRWLACWSCPEGHGCRRRRNRSSVGYECAPLSPALARAAPSEEKGITGGRDRRPAPRRPADWSVLRSGEFRHEPGALWTPDGSSATAHVGR
jgi:hypothetical protein